MALTAEWERSNRWDSRALPLADRHYNRRKVGSPQFVPPGRNLVFLTPEATALWVSSWPIAEYVRHAWSGAWVNTLFRNEGPELASELIRAAVASTRSLWGAPPRLGMVSFIDARKVRPKRDPGYCYLMAGWRLVGKTAGGLLVYQQLPGEMPEPAPLRERQLTLLLPSSPGAAYNDAVAPSGGQEPHNRPIGPAQRAGQQGGISR